MSDGGPGLDTPRTLLSDPERLGVGTAFKLLGQLIESSPNYGAFPYFRAMVRNKLRQPDEEIIADYTAAAEALHFDALVLPLSQEIYKWGIRDASHYYAATSGIAKLPIPDYYNAMQPLLKFIDNSDENFATHALALGERLMRQNANASSRREFVFWVALEYQVGHVIAKRAWQKLHPDDAPPAELTKTYKDFLDNDRFRKPWSEAFEAKSDCDPRKLGDLIDAETKSLADWRPAERDDEDSAP